MIITTTDSIETHEITSYLGVITGSSYVYAKRLKEMKASAQPELVARAEEEAKAAFIAKAEEMSATAIVGVSLDFENVNGAICIVYSGTAVRCVRKG